MLRKWIGGLAMAAVVMLLTGCAKPPAPGGTGTKASVAKAGHDHSDWWCAPHGIPEDECSMCQANVAKEFKAKGDWCKVHPDRAASQCFICNPKQAEVYAAKYRAKYDKEPPPAPENMAKKDDQ